MQFPGGLVSKTLWTSAAGNTALWVPTAGKRWRITRLMTYFTSNATTGNQGREVVISLREGDTPLDIAWTVYLPAVSLLGNLPGVLQSWNSGWMPVGAGSGGTLGGATDGVLNLNLSNALTAGKCGVIALGYEDV